MRQGFHPIPPSQPIIFVSFKLSFINTLLDYVLDSATATIEFPDLTLDGSEDIRFTGSYSFEVSFDMATLDINRISPDSYQVTGLSLIEEFQPGTPGYTATDFSNYLDFSLDLPFQPKALKNRELDFRQETLENGRELRTARQEDTSFNLTIESNTVTETEKNYLLAWFIVSKGKLNRFSFAGSFARFATDSLSLSLVRYQGCSYYSFDDLPFQALTGISNTIIRGYIDTSSIDVTAQAAIADAYNTFANLFSDGSVTVLPPILNGSERWVSWFADRSNIPQGSNVFTLGWIDESNPVYHGSSQPTTDYLDDYNDLISNHNPGDRYHLFATSDSSGGASQYAAFVEHVRNAVAGTNGYPSLVSLADSISVTYDFSVFATADSFIQEIINVTREVHSLAYVLRLSRPGAETYGFTSLDFDLDIGGVVYQSNSAIDPSATATEVNLSTDNLEIKSLIDSDQINPQQLVSGYFDEAQVTLALVDFVNYPTAIDEGVVLLQGRVGRVTLSDSTFVFEIRSLSELLNKPVSEKTSPICDHGFGDGRCKLDLRARGLLFENVAIAARGTNALDFDSVPFTQDFVNGTITVKTGVNNGLKLTIVAVDEVAQVLTYRGEIVEQFAIGDLVDVVAYCRKDQVACKNYNNFLNFGGIPSGGNFIPGLDRITVLP